MKYLRCNKCGWIHYELDPIASTYSYDVTKCFKCKNSHKDFTAYTGIVPVGITIQPILNKELEAK